MLTKGVDDMGTIATPSAATGTLDARPVTVESPYRFTADQYERMVNEGILVDGDRVELIDGILVSKVTKSPEHGYSGIKIVKSIYAFLPAEWTWRVEQPIRIPEYNEPEPDVAILRGTDEDYEHRTPGPDDTGLVIEIAVTSLGHDRRKKRAAYATAGIAVYWIVNVKDRQVEVYTAPQPGAYGSCTSYNPGELVPIVLDGNQIGEIAVQAILPRVSEE
jgi:Uma2 family endonuclease